MELTLQYLHFVLQPLFLLFVDLEALLKLSQIMKELVLLLLYANLASREIKIVAVNPLRFDLSQLRDLH